MGLWGLRIEQVALTWRVAGTERLRPSVEMLMEMLMPAKRRLLLPRMEASALLGAWGQHKAQGGGSGSWKGELQGGGVGSALDAWGLERALPPLRVAGAGHGQRVAMASPPAPHLPSSSRSHGRPAQLHGAG